MALKPPLGHHYRLAVTPSAKLTAMFLMVYLPPWSALRYACARDWPVREQSRELLCGCMYVRV